MNKKTFESSFKQTGVALVISLIILLIMTLLGVSVMNINILEEKMVNNDRHYKEALHTAELTLREGEKQIDPEATYSNVVTTTSSNNGLYLSSAASVTWWDDVDWDNSVQVKTSSSSTSEIPLKYIVEQLPAPSSDKDSKEAGVALTQKYYRVTSRALVPGTNAKVMLQSTFKK